MADRLLGLYVWQLTARAAVIDRLRRGERGERGEGVISAAIAVLIMAFLGVAVWAGFKQTLEKTQTRVDDQVERIQ